jgi:hypothetical protein
MKKAERWFYPGERVRVYYKSVGEWKEATIRSMILLPKQRSPNPSYYQVTCEGKENPRYYRPKELQPVKRTASAAKPRARAKRGAAGGRGVTLRTDPPGSRRSPLPFTGGAPTARAARARRRS